MNNETIIREFYTSFATGDYQKMTSFYHEDIVFRDPVFGKLEGERVSEMWKMLLSNKSAKLKVEFSDIKTFDNQGEARWKASYLYGKKKRQVINYVHANFKFREGKIVEHFDNFSMSKWSSQALGTVGILLGWAPLLKNKIKKEANKALDKYIEKLK